MPGTNLATAYVQVVPSARGISGALSNVLNGEANAAGASAGKSIASKLKGAIVAAGIGTAVIGGLKSALSEGGALQQSYLGGLDTLYGDAADQARRYADEAVKAGISQNSFAEQAVSFGAALKQAYGGDTTKAMEAANTAILDMADNAAKMGTPLQSIQDAYQGFAKQNYTMLDNLKLGYGGTKSEMERLLADAEKLTGKKYDISNLGDVYDAIHAIQGDLGLTGVAADEAATTFTGSLGAMKAAFDNLMGNMMLGQNVGPAMQNLAQTASTFLFDNLMPAIGNIFKSLPTAISTFINTGLPKFVKAGMSLVKSLAKGAKDNLPEMIKTFMTGLENMTGNLREGFSKFVDIGLGLIKSIADGIIKNIPTFVETVPTILDNIAGLINDNAPKLITTGVGIIKALIVGLVKAIPLIIRNMPKILKAIYSVIMAFSWVNLGKFAIKGLSKGLKAMATKVKTTAGNIRDKITTAIRAVPGKIKGAIQSIKDKLSFKGLLTKVKQVFQKIKDAIKEKMDAAKKKVEEIIGKIKKLFPFNVGKIFTGWIPKISLKTKKSDDSASTTSSVKHTRFAKAMNNPYMFKRPTEFYAGEAGDEMLYGRRSLMNDIAEAVREGGSQGGSTFYVTLNATASESPEEYANRFGRELKRLARMGAF